VDCSWTATRCPDKVEAPRSEPMNFALRITLI
jgi:hypothetical protein